MCDSQSTIYGPKKWGRGCGIGKKNNIELDTER